MTETVIRLVAIYGRVQGVGFRDWAARTAARLGVEGWARNRNDGTVEAAFAGSPASVAAMIGACRQGPRGAVVTSINERHGDDNDLRVRGERRGFVILPTA